MLGREYTTAKLPGNTGRLSRRGSPPLCRRGCPWVRFSIFSARRNYRSSRLSTWTSRSPGGRCLAPFGVGPSKGAPRDWVRGASLASSPRGGRRASGSGLLRRFQLVVSNRILAQLGQFGFKLTELLTAAPIDRAFTRSNYSRASRELVKFVYVVPALVSFNHFLIFTRLNPFIRAD